MATKDTNYLVAVHKGLDESLEKQVAALPEKFNKQRFLQNCMTVLQDGQSTMRANCDFPKIFHMTQKCWRKRPVLRYRLLHKRYNNFQNYSLWLRKVTARYFYQNL